MDLYIVILIGSALFLTGLVICLLCVGFGRVAIAFASIAAIAGAVAVGCLQTGPILGDSPVNTFDEINEALDQLERNLLISQVGMNVAGCAVIAFCISGSLRVWRQRSTLVARYNADSSPPVESSVNPENQRVGVKQLCVVIAALVICVFLLWQDLHNFVVRDSPCASLASVR